MSGKNKSINGTSRNIRKINIFNIFLFFLLVSNSCSEINTDDKEESTIVDYFGQLRVEGRNIVDKKGEIIILRGMSLFWSQWGSEYYNEETIKWLRDDWKCTVIRAPIGVENGGYLDNKLTEFARTFEVIDACIKLGIYVIVDWHDHSAENHLAEAMEFFQTISNKYGNEPNILYKAKFLSFCRRGLSMPRSRVLVW
ncbi:MAG: cellulase family glycosylhydrolase, partial [Calditrichaceae bacterium]